MTGEVTGLSERRPQYRLTVEASHASFTDSAALLAPGYHPRDTHAGPLAVQARLSGGWDAPVTFDDLRARLGSHQPDRHGRVAAQGSLFPPEGNPECG